MNFLFPPLGHFSDRSSFVLPSVIACSLLLTFFNAQAKSEDEALSHFREAVAPVLAAKCISCHRPDNLKGNLDLSQRESLLRGGDNGPALTPHQPDQSSLYVRTIGHQNEPPEMPEKGDPLTAKEAEHLRRWIEQGAVWPEGYVVREPARGDATFWSFQPLRRESPPTLDPPTAGWDEHPIDRFLDARLRTEGLTPNAPADLRALIRRATYDLIGLPPTPAEVQDFLTAAALDRDVAYRALIDRLLESPRYGEHWGRHWLDVIRFGESRGYERNEIITNLWPFRDYVIRSFNEDKPFDQLIREHLAGDVIGKDQPEIEVGSAFLVAGPYDDVGNQDAMAAAQIRADQMDEMIRATSEAFLGLTLGCARCHDHKFDPLPTRDYYAFYATFAGTTHGVREVSTAQARTARNEQLKPLQEARAKAIGTKEALEKTLQERVKQAEAEFVAAWTRPRISRYGTEEIFEPMKAKYLRMTVEGTDSPDPKSSQFKIDEFEVWTDETNSRNVALLSSGAKATGASRDAKDFSGAYGVELAIDGKFGERWQSSGRELQIEFATVENIRRVYFSSDRTHGLGEDHTLTTFVGDYRIEVSLDGKAWTEVATSKDRQAPTEARKQARILKAITTDEDQNQLKQLTRDVQRLDQEIARVPALPSWWVGNHAPAAGPFNVFIGGNPQQRGDPVVPASLSVLGQLSSAYQLNEKEDEGQRRLKLAQWITAPDHPLTARVLANRLWLYHFGQGIVATPSDFGYMGSRPSHPELLDWLALQLLEHGWQIKPLHRLIMTSQAYQQSSQWREEPARVDGDSRLLWRFPPRRLQAEEIRDTLLLVSGKLNETMGGPGFRLYEYQQDNVATYVPLDVHGPETYRRAVYHHNARAARVDIMTDFDCPDPAFAEPRRASTTTPIQALTLMNHSFTLDMANAFAERIARERSEVEGQVKLAFELAFGRAPQENELRGGIAILREHGPRAFCRALLNSNELISLN